LFSISAVLAQLWGHVAPLPLMVWVLVLVFLALHRVWILDVHLQSKLAALFSWMSSQLKSKTTYSPTPPTTCANQCMDWRFMPIGCLTSPIFQPKWIPQIFLTTDSVNSVFNRWFDSSKIQTSK
jgi:hypothetical protein